MLVVFITTNNAAMKISLLITFSAKCIVNL